MYEAKGFFERIVKATYVLDIGIDRTDLIGDPERMITLTNHKNAFVHFNAGALQLNVTCMIHGPPLSSHFALTP